MQRDVLIFGGGIAGLWLLDEVVRRGYSALLVESTALGHGQTVASQGIIHGGLKYTLQGLLTGSAAAIREMPQVWRECLAGQREPQLTNTPIRSECCYLWRTESVTSRLGMIGARIGLRVAPQNLTTAERPSALANVPGSVARLDEQVISPAGLVRNFADRHQERILQVDPQRTEFQLRSPGQIKSVRLVHPRTEETLTVTAEQFVFTAGAGNADLRQRAGLDATVMQRRPLHMVLVRGDLPVLNGHCVDGAKTRVTITSDTDTAGRTIWQVGGQISETGVSQSPAELIAQTRAELLTVLPGLDLSQAEWAAYRVDRAEGRTTNGGRPETFQIRREGSVITAWPTKLVLAPQLATEIADTLTPPAIQSAQPLPSDWPRPSVAQPPWECAALWTHSGTAPHRRVA